MRNETLALQRRAGKFIRRQTRGYDATVGHRYVPVPQLF